jgi:starch synthase (maltosyl-transferring)
MKLLDHLESYLRELSGERPMWIPRLWNRAIDYANIIEETAGGLKVNAPEFYLRVLDVIKARQKQLNPSAENLQHSVIYCTMPRYTTAWTDADSGALVPGSLLRHLILLPLLSDLGVDILYLLPITKYTERYLKGDIGSPFAPLDFVTLDPNLRDPLLLRSDISSVEDQFRLLVEASHLVGMKVVLDFIPRVIARDTTLLTTHPDWFYWIKLEEADEFAPPVIPGLDRFVECTVDNINHIYSAASTRDHLAKFVDPPNVAAPERWRDLVKKARETGDNLLALVEQDLRITTPPAHSDWVNDTQPVWTDITFFKLYMDPWPEIRRHLPCGQAPYVMFDSIKGNKFPGLVPNTELWKLFEDVLTHYMAVYDVDGFRFDIGHTLPPELLRRLLRLVKNKKPGAILISEDLFNHNHADAVQNGYNVMLGSGWRLMAESTKDSLTEFIKDLASFRLCVYAGGETHDTPRLVTRRGGTAFARMLAVFNYFLPNATPFIITGYEVNEARPLNCGLADNTGNRPIPRAFFNQMRIEWDREGAGGMVSLLQSLVDIKRKVKEALRPETFRVEKTPQDVVAYSYGLATRLVLVVANLGRHSASLTGCFKNWLGTVIIDSQAGPVWCDLSAGWELEPFQAVVIQDASLADAEERHETN